MSQRGQQTPGSSGAQYNIESHSDFGKPAENMKRLNQKKESSMANVQQINNNNNNRI